MYEWMSTCPFVCVSFHPSSVLSRLGLFDISPYWISHKAFAILQWPFILYTFLMVYRIPLLILRSSILKYNTSICVFLCFILSFSVNVSQNLFYNSKWLQFPMITFDVKSSKILVTKLALIPHCRCWLILEAICRLMLLRWEKEVRLKM